MKEKTLIRLYQGSDQRAAHHGGQHYRPSEDVVGWDFAEGDQIGLCEEDGGYLMGVIDHVEPEVHRDETGEYRLASVWTQD